MSARQHLAGEEHRLGPHRDKDFSVKKVYFNNCQIFLSSQFIFPKKYKIKQVHQRIRNHIKTKTHCVFFFISIQAFFPYIYTYSLNQSDKHQNLSVAFSFMTTFYILNPKYVLLFSSFLQYTPTHAIIQLGRGR